MSQSRFVKGAEREFVLEPGDGLWLPAHTWMIYIAKQATCVVAVHPGNWRGIHGMES